MFSDQIKRSKLSLTKTNYSLSFLFLFLNLLVTPTQVSAQINLGNAITSQPLPQFRIQNIGTLIMRSLETVLLITGLWMFICIVWSGIEWQLARGSKGDIEKSKTRLTNCVLGLAVASMAYAVILVVQYFVGLDQVFPT